jgi:hypothetical protein
MEKAREYLCVGLKLRQRKWETRNQSTHLRKTSRIERNIDSGIDRPSNSDKGKAKVWDECLTNGG